MSNFFFFGIPSGHLIMLFKQSAKIVYIINPVSPEIVLTFFSVLESDAAASLLLIDLFCAKFVGKIGYRICRH